ncbi:RND efflux system outer membrane lipoprotein [Pseudomonas sp. M47T1]|uniref:efflux transporter outer membrane subunit n=1 Tax=Pseudomonas sp. M47T1 TaxID=1179778 RepID=UPI0002608C11|nr:efflux transporter outer membrane subunit [Pseudomonas sp. M47T1]EIK95880.1 RND efflux system outer membrane lipoprotein [Pseudomonas sp. M47T1]
MVRALTPLALALLSACSLAPAYQVPPIETAAQYRNVGPWTPAQPADQMSRDGWWAIYHDSRLNALQQQLAANNPDLSAALAHYAQAQAYLAQVRSDLFPLLKGFANPQRIRQSDTRPLRATGGPSDYNSVTVGVEVDYEVDLWGRVRNSVNAGTDEAQAAAADLASARLSLQTQLTDNYIRLRGLDQQTQLLTATTEAFGKALSLTEGLHGGGIVSGLDVARARTQLSSAKSQLSQNQTQRALMEHAIAALVGAQPAQFSLPMDTARIELPVVPTGVPSALLQRRPDIAAAERRVAEANAKIGIARAAYFPTITLSPQIGYQSDQYAGLLAAPNLFWSIGPSLVATLLDGGKRKAGVDAARAATDEAAGHYRSVVLGAFQQVEDNLTLIAGLGNALQDQRDAASAAHDSESLALSRYKDGAVGYLDVVEAQTASLQAQSGVLDLQTRQLSANVQLVKSLGGGWSTEQNAQAER